MLYIPNKALPQPLTPSTPGKKKTDRKIARNPIESRDERTSADQPKSFRPFLVPFNGRTLLGHRERCMVARF